ncbi:MAG: NUDIX hydrolase [Acidimicrobiales bacterium]|nr:NUDIX hydrolase [Acidimicrobiales bacterium]
MAERRPSPPGVEPTPAATVVLLREGGAGLEVLMLRRSSRGPFGGMWVFPGGQVEAMDWPAEPAEAGGGSVHRAAGAEFGAARQAAVREAEEEAGLVLDADALIVLSFWLPPPETPRRFATWFFLAPSEAGAEVAVDQREIHEHRWIAPGAAMNLRQRGELQLVPPTFVTLWWLHRQGSTEAALAAAAARPAERFESRVARSQHGDLTAVLWAGDAGYDDHDMDRPGPRRRIVLDPAGWQVEIDE